MNQLSPLVDEREQKFAIANAVDSMIKGLNPNDPLTPFYVKMISDNRGDALEGIRKHAEAAMSVSNAFAKAFRKNPRAREVPKISDLLKSGALTKAQLDVGTLTNFASITGGQSLGYVSLDTQMARGTTRPNAFTLYQSLHKSAAFQVVDYWAFATDTGGGLPGTAFQSFGNVATGSLTTSAGKYSLKNITLKLAVNGRSITTALAAQNSFVDITAQENINAALTVLESINWTCYWGNPTFYANQFTGIQQAIVGDATASGNIFDYQSFYNTYASGQGWSSAQTMFNLIYQAAGQITGYQTYGRTTHAFMSPICAGALQQLVTTLLNNIVAGTGRSDMPQGIIVNGDLQGIKTRFGEIQFPVDLYITARDKPAQTVIYGDGTTPATTTSPTRPVTVTAAVSAVAASFTTAYTGVATGGASGAGTYSYAVASTDAAMNESYVTYLSSGSIGCAVSGVLTTSSVVLTITGPVAADATNFRVYRSGLGYAPATSGVANPASYRYIGTVAANGGAAVTFTDGNTYIPGSETVFLLDMDENDNAIDFRFLLPLTKIELFAANLYMPWAVCEIGAIRLRVPKFHGYIKNFVPDNPDFNPLLPNPNAT